jgi:hypothetical protein
MVIGSGHPKSFTASLRFKTSGPHGMRAPASQQAASLPLPLHRWYAARRACRRAVKGTYPQDVALSFFDRYPTLQLIRAKALIISLAYHR